MVSKSSPSFVSCTANWKLHVWTMSSEQQPPRLRYFEFLLNWDSSKEWKFLCLAFRQHICLRNIRLNNRVLMSSEWSWLNSLWVTVAVSSNIEESKTYLFWGGVICVALAFMSTSICQLHVCHKWIRVFIHVWVWLVTVYVSVGVCYCIFEAAWWCAAPSCQALPSAVSPLGADLLSAPCLFK